jgi:cytochrome c-type biogenesis protein CcmF
MWYRTSIQRLGRASLWPAVGSTVFIVVLFIFGVRLWPALLGFWLVTFSAVLTVMEFVKGTRARMRKGESAWTAFSTLTARNRRRYGGYWIHMGVLIMAFGIVADGIYQTETQIRLQAGESVTVGDFEMTFNSVSRFPGADDLLITQADVDLYKNGEFVRKLTPEIEFYQRTGQPMTIPSARSTITEDFYVILVNWEPTTADAATFRIFLNPLINWVWAGGIIFVIGTLIAAWPDREKAPARARKPALAAAGD